MLCPRCGKAVSLSAGSYCPSCGAGIAVGVLTPPPTGSSAPVDQTIAPGLASPQLDAEKTTYLAPADTDSTTFTPASGSGKGPTVGPADADRTIFVPFGHEEQDPVRSAHNPDGTMFVPASGASTPTPPSSRYQPPKDFAAATIAGHAGESGSSQSGPLSIGQSIRDPVPHH